MNGKTYAVAAAGGATAGGIGMLFQWLWTNKISPKLEEKENKGEKESEDSKEDEKIRRIFREELNRAQQEAMKDVMDAMGNTAEVNTKNTEDDNNVADGDDDDNGDDADNGDDDDNADDDDPGVEYHAGH